ncbi:DUF4384 domain-containing protein [Sulfitobacter sediminilitoris]|uniref:DUF4384 domain-containing protein n=1 Tax=Sulfitobacter sediminilitoris TaxID=2698830 RepID=UPI0036DC2852
MIASALVHVAAAAGLMAALQPEPIKNQPTPSSRLNVEAQQVTRSEAAEQAPPAEKPSEEATKGAALGVGAIVQSVAEAISAPTVAAEIQDPESQTETGQLFLPSLTPTPAAQPDAPQAVLASPATIKAAQSAPTAVSAAPAPVPAAAVRPDVPPAVATAPTAPKPTAAPPKTPPSATAPAQAPRMTASKAVLAFPAAGSVDPVSLAAFQSFTQPDATNGVDVRDTVGAALSVPCSRMQVTFDPDTTTLRLTGHVPQDSQRGPVLAALREQMGEDIAVTDNLLVLPAPQCAALSGIASVGLPQSTDQITNPLIVGADTHARAFDFVKDQPLVLEMTGADYPAYVYVDYFDAAGNVIHLSPNEASPLTQVPPKQPIDIGARQPGEPGLHVIIGPPYGQEIAAAFAASVPLYEGLRPVIEPADAYLEWMKSRVAEARAAHADFKGEWVYFFVTTKPE